jgi:glucan phosphoethanolaminetransferase (alkaline phosphatase superfamily)
MTPLILLVVPALLTIAAFLWTLGPLLRAARDTRSPSKFLLSDLAWLMVQLQLGLGVAIWAYPEKLESSVRMVGLTLAVLPVVLFWMASLHLVSQAGITRPWRRAAVMVVLLPGMAATVFAIPVFAIGLLASLLDQSASETFDLKPRSLAAWLVVFSATALALGWLSRWAVAQPPLAQSLVEEDCGSRR